MNAEGILPPAHLSESIHSIVQRDLHPRAWNVFSKLVLLQGLIGGLSLLVCSQFGFGSGHYVAAAFMRFGESTCMALCGALFLGLTALIASLVLRPAEVRLIRRFGCLPILVVGLLSLGIFLGFGAEIVISLAFFWLLGGFIAGLIATEAGWQLRTQLPRLL